MWADDFALGPGAELALDDVAGVRADSVLQVERVAVGAKTEDAPIAIHAGDREGPALVFLPGGVAPRAVEDAGVAGARVERDRGAHLEVGVHRPRHHVVGIAGVAARLAGAKIDPPQIEDSRIAAVEPDQQLVGVVRIGEELIRPHPRKRRQVAARPRLGVETPQVPVLVTFFLTLGEQRAAVAGPLEIGEPLALVQERHRIAPPDRDDARPQNAPGRALEPRQAAAVGGERGRDPLRPREQGLARNERRRRGGARYRYRDTDRENPAESKSTHDPALYLNRAHGHGCRQEIRSPNPRPATPRATRELRTPRKRWLLASHQE